MSDDGIDLHGGKLQNFTIDQFAGALALTLGSVGGLLMVIWKSRCSCKVRLGLSDKCYLFDCSREPPAPDADSDDEDAKPVGKANAERDRTKGRRVLSEDRATPKEIRDGTYPEQVSEEEEDILPVEEPEINGRTPPGP